MDFLQDLIDLSMSPTNVVFRWTALFLFGFLIFRLLGFGQKAQRGITGAIAILLVFNAIQNGYSLGRKALIEGLILASVLTLISWLVSFF